MGGDAQHAICRDLLATPLHSVAKAEVAFEATSNHSNLGERIINTACNTSLSFRNKIVLNFNIAYFA